MQIAILPSDLAAAEAARSEAANDAASTDNTEADHQQYWIDDADSRAQVGAAAAQLVADTPQAVANARAQSGPGAFGLTGLALDNFDRDFQQRSEALPEAARPAFAQLAKPYRDAIGARAVSIEAADRLAWRAGAYTQSADQWGEAVARDPALLPAAVGALRDTLPHLDAGQSDALAEYARDKLVQGGVAHGLAQDPAALHAALYSATGDEGAPDHPLAALMTAPERAHYLEAARIGVLAQQTMQREQTRALAAEAGPQLLATGQADNVPTRAQLVAHLGEEEGTRLADSLQMDAATGSARRLIAPLSEAEFARLEVQPAAAGAQGAQDQAALKRAIGLERDERRAKPIDYALRSGLYGIAPIADFNDAPAVAAELVRRRNVSSSIAADYGTAPAALSSEEASRLTQTLNGLPPAGQYDLLQRLHQGLGDAALAQQVMRGLSADSPVIAVAGSQIAPGVTNGSPGDIPFGGDGRISAARTALEGYALLHPPEGKSPPPLPPDPETRAAFAQLIGERYAQQPGMEEARYQTALANYVSLRGAGRGDPKALDPALFGAAVRLADEGDGTAREIGLVPQASPEDFRLQRMRNTFADASDSMGIVSDAGVQAEMEQTPGFKPELNADNALAGDEAAVSETPISERAAPTASDRNGLDIQDDFYQERRAFADSYVKSTGKSLKPVQQAYLSQRLNADLQRKCMSDDEVKKVVDFVASQKSLITQDQLKEIFPNIPKDKLGAYTFFFNTYLPLYGIDNPQRQAAFFGQIGQETGGLTTLRENMYYTNSARVRSLWPRLFPSDESVAPYLRNPDALANRVYSNRLGNGDESSGDGAKYRGSGILQITGKDNFQNLGDGIGVDLIRQPELLWNDVETSIRAALQYWNERKINDYADNHGDENLKEITRRVNGAGLVGLAERTEATKAALKILTRQDK